MGSMFKECFKGHALAHSLAGAGVALIVLHFVPVLIAHKALYGVILIVIAVIWDFLVNPARKRV